MQRKYWIVSHTLWLSMASMSLYCSICITSETLYVIICIHTYLVQYVLRCRMSLKVFEVNNGKFLALKVTKNDLNPRKSWKVFEFTWDVIGNFWQIWHVMITVAMMLLISVAFSWHTCLYVVIFLTTCFNILLRCLKVYFLIACLGKFLTLTSGTTKEWQPW